MGIQLDSTPFYVDLSQFVKGIYLGAKIKQNYEERIKSIGKTRNIPIYKMRLSETEYKLIPDSLV